MAQLLNDAIKFCNDWKSYNEDTQDCDNISVVIPIYHPTYLHHILEHLCHVRGIKEVILVDDSAENKEIQVYKYDGLNIILIRHKSNYGRPIARNTGAAYATGDILVFMDQDMLIDPQFFIQASKLLIANNGKGIALGLRDTMNFSDIPNIENWHGPDLSRDWRISTVVSESFIDLTVMGVGSATNQCCPNQRICLYAQTDQFRKFGVAPDQTCGFWDLPSMVISHSMAVSKNEFLRIGGFPEWISGWGGEDIVIGFSAVATGNPIMLTGSVSYHIQHPPYSGSEKQKNIELLNNIKQYRQWAQNAVSFPRFEIAEKAERGYRIY